MTHVPWRLAATVVGLFAAATVAAAQTGATPAEVDVLHDVEFGTGGGRALKMEVVRPRTPPDRPMPVVVFIHGGGWRTGSPQTGVSKLTGFASRGYFCASVEYRLLGEAPFPAQIEDCKCAIRFLRAKAKEYRLDPDRIGVWGASAGGHLAALVGTSGGVKEIEGRGGHAAFSSRVQAVCDWCGPTDLVEMTKSARNGELIVTTLIGAPFAANMDKVRLASPVTHVSKDDPPFLIMHGADDQTVAVRHSELLHEFLQKAGVESTLHVLRGQKHGIQGPEATRLVDEFFDKHLKAAGRVGGK